MARKGLYTPEIAAKLVEYLSQAVTVKDACALVGIAPQTFFQWCKRDASFRDATTRARAQGRLSAVLVIQDSVLRNKDTESAKWLLERTDPENWGRRDKLILDIDPRLLRELKALLEANELSASDIFQDLINELSTRSGKQ